MKRFLAAIVVLSLMVGVSGLVLANGELFHAPIMAAPSIAELILEAEGVPAHQSLGKGKARTQLNLVNMVAQHMNSSESTGFYCEEYGDESKGYLVPKSIWVGERGEQEV